MRPVLIALAVAGFIGPALAEDGAATKPVVLHVGQVIRDADMNKIGPISEVENDGSVQVIYEQHLLTLPAATLSVVDGKAKTSLSRHDLTHM